MDCRCYNVKEETATNGRQQCKEELEHSIKDVANCFQHPARPEAISENIDVDDVEQASLDIKLTAANVGFRLLQKMGWKGKGLGKDEQGILEPIRSGIRDPKLGVGKQEEDDFFTAEENIQRRKLDVEVEETEEHTKKREVVAEREQKIQTEVQEIRRVFYCDLCHKQYKLAMEFEVHLSSYDHNHRKRFKQMRVMHGSGSSSSRRNSSSCDGRKKRESQRQEREMAKSVRIADAQKQQQMEELGAFPEAAAAAASASAAASLRNLSQLADQDQRKVLKFAFSPKASSSRNSCAASGANKPKAAVSSFFANDDGDEQA